MAIFWDAAWTIDALPVHLLRQVFLHHFSCFCLMFVQAGFRQFFEASWRSCWRPFRRHFPCFLSIEKCIDFYIDFGRLFGGFMGGQTFENGGLVYTKRSFWQSHLFRSRGGFQCKMEPNRLPKWSQQTIKNRSTKWCIFSLKKVPSFNGKWVPGGAQRDPQIKELGGRFAPSPQDPPKGVKWSQHDSKMEPKWR